MHSASNRPKAAIQTYKVGGAVRDELLGRPVSEVDWVVVGATANDLLAQGFRPVGADFPVFLHPKTGEEYALARTERKSGRGYGGFVFHASPEVTLEQDLARRDLTINAMAQDDQGQLIDPYQGLSDLRAGLLRHVSPAFAEDPLRVLRVARFAARYAPLGFRIAPDTLALMRQLADSGELRDLTPERTWKEVSRALMEERPDVFIQVLQDCNALGELWPELESVLAPSATSRAQLAKVLRLSAEQQQPLEVRWACLLRPLAEAPERGTAALAAINQRSKVPKNCQDAALLEEHLGQARAAQALKAEDLDALLRHFDSQRRPWRLEQFVRVEELNAEAQGQSYPQGTYLRAAADQLRTLDPQPLIAAGYQGATLGKALQQQRLTALEQYRRQHAD